MTEWGFILSVRILFVMSATDKPTDQERWPWFFMSSNALQSTKIRKYFKYGNQLQKPWKTGAIHLILKMFFNSLCPHLSSHKVFKMHNLNSLYIFTCYHHLCPYLSNNGLVELVPGAISACAPELITVLLITATVRQNNSQGQSCARLAGTLALLLMQIQFKTETIKKER